jgi:quinolinate synthase
MQKVAPGKKFYFVGAKQICPNMKRITLENIRDCLKNNTPKAFCSDELREKSCKPLARMLEIAK